MKDTKSIDDRYGKAAGGVIRRYLAKIANHQKQIAALKAQVESLKAEVKALPKK